MGAVPVTVAQVSQKDVPLQLRTIGSVEAYQTVQVKSMIGGQIDSVNFKEGDDVRRGQRLFQIDRRPLEAALHQAEAQLARDDAQAKDARSQAVRYAELFSQGVVSKIDNDTRQTAAEADEAAVQADKASVENARVQLQYTTIDSPLDGRTGNLEIHAGNLIKANDTPFLVTINKIQPIYVTFTLPEQQLAEVKRYMSGGHKLAVTTEIPNDPKPASGTLTFIDNAVDQQTGTIKLKGTFENADRRLWPGQFVNVVLTLANQPNATVVPATAVQTGQAGSYVFLVTKENTAESRPIKVFRTVENLAVVEGIQPGETVVTDGQVRLTPGAKVEIKNAAGSPTSAPGSGTGQNAKAAKQDLGS